MFLNQVKDNQSGIKRRSKNELYDILEKLEKEGIISAEGVIDSYLLCKHAEELFGKSYLKEHNIVLDDDKKEAKICKKGS